MSRSRWTALNTTITTAGVVLGMLPVVDISELAYSPESSQSLSQPNLALQQTRGWSPTQEFLPV